MDKPILIFEKRADKALHKIIIPQFFVIKHGYEYYMEIYEDKIILKPKGE